ncbi:Hypothetical protein NocV09_02900280, partial [Nannochloropsis oceanica]
RRCQSDVRRSLALETLDAPPVPCRGQEWRRRRRPVVVELHKLISLENWGGKPYDLGEETLTQVEGMLAEARTVLTAESNKQGVRCLSAWRWCGRAKRHLPSITPLAGSTSRARLSRGGAARAEDRSREGPTLRQWWKMMERKKGRRESGGGSGGRGRGGGRSRCLVGKRRSDGGVAGPASKRRYQK